MVKRFLISILIANSIMACNNHEDASPYGELLSKRPYADLTDSIRQNSKNADLYYRRGILLKKNDNLSPALADFRKAWELDKKEEYAVAVSSVLSSRPDSAIAFIQSALKDFPTSIALQLNLVQAYSDFQRTDEALKLCEKIISQQPNQLDALEMKADLLEKKNDLPGSVKTLEQAYSLAPFDEQLCYNLANKYAQTKNPKVLKLCDSLLSGKVKRPEPYYFIGVYYENLDQPAKAISFFDQAILQDYNFLDAHMDKGKILYDEKKYNEAIKVFELTLKISSTYADAYYWLGKCQEALGKTEEAKPNYLRAYGLDKSFTEAKEAADRLNRQ